MMVKEIVTTYLKRLALTEAKSFGTTTSHAQRLLDQRDDVSCFDVQGYQACRKEEGAKNATINRECEILKFAIAHARRAGNYNGPLKDIPRLPENNTRQGFFEKEEFDRLCEHLPVGIKLAAKWAYYTGWRKSEIFGLTWSQVTNIEVRLADSKNGSPRVVPLSGPLYAILEEAKVYRTPLWVFHTGDGTKLNDIRRPWERACRQAGLTNKLFHDLRRTAVRNMIEAGIDRQIVKQITGHKTDSMLNRYCIVSKDQMSKALEKL